jgi:GAF domain-containing protein
VTTLIQERVGFYHVQIFLVNTSGDQAELIASTGDVGQRLLARHHQLTVGSQSVIGQVTLRGEPVIARDTDRDDVYFRNELLINTRSELALPIRDGANIVGALDVQSELPDAFDRSDIQALQIIADFLGAAIRNSNQYQEQSKVAQENRRLLNEAEANLREIQRLNRELTGASWEEYARSDRAITGVTLENNRLLEVTEWTESLQAAGAEGHAVTAQDGERGVVAVPLKLRGEVIGAIEVEALNPTSQETVEMVEAVAQRLAISLENARLYEESREATAQEQFINDLAARYQSVSTVDDLLRLTLLELGETLGAQHGAIRLGNMEAALDEPQNGAAR